MSENNIKEEVIKHNCEVGHPTIVRTTKQYNGLKRCIGIIMALLSSVSLTGAMLFVKVLEKNFKFDGYKTSFWRHMGILVPVIFIIIFNQCRSRFTKINVFQPEKSVTVTSVFDSVWPLNRDNNWKTAIGLLSISIIGSFSVILRYCALEYLPVADTSVITKSSPILVTLMGHFFLGEKCGIFSTLMVFTTLTGVIIVTKPPLLTGEAAFDKATLIGTSLALGSLFCSCLSITITRKIRKAHFSLVMFAHGSFGIFHAWLMEFIMADTSVVILPTGLSESLLTLGLAVVSFIGVFAMTIALKFEEAGIISLVRNTDVVFGFLLQYFFLGVIPDKYSVIGGTIVLLGVFAMGCRKWIQTLPENHSIKQTCSCILF